MLINFTFFHFTTFWIELKNINMVLKQLHKTNASNGYKIRKYHVSMSNEQLEEACNLHFFLLHQFGLQLFHISVFQFDIMFCYNCTIGLLTTVTPCSSNASGSLFGILQIVTRSNSVETQAYTKTLVFKTCNSKERKFL